MDCNRKKKEENVEPKYRNDENVLRTIPAQYRYLDLVRYVTIPVKHIPHLQASYFGHSIKKV